MIKKIPTHDPQTGELNPYYKELTGQENPFLVPQTNKTVLSDPQMSKSIKRTHDGNYVFLFKNNAIEIDDFSYFGCMEDSLKTSLVDSLVNEFQSALECVLFKKHQIENF